ncbi:MAG: bacteriohemerythrin [bacterium]
MTLVTWREEYNTGIEDVDYEHQLLIKMINSVYKLLEKREKKDEIIDSLADIYAHISSHFMQEELLMERNQYEQISEHTNDHNRLLNEIICISNEFKRSDQFEAELLKRRLDQWFSVHFKTHDARLHTIALETEQHPPTLMELFSKARTLYAEQSISEA